MQLSQSFVVLAAALVASAMPSPDVGSNEASLAKRASGSGQATVFDAGLGACGIQNSGSDFIVALSAPLWDSMSGAAGCAANPNACPWCNKPLTATIGSNTVTVSITDRCQQCAFNDLDFSAAPFAQLTGGQTTGRFPVSWSTGAF